MPIHKSRWNPPTAFDAPVLSHEGLALPLAVTGPMTAEQLDAYVTHIRIGQIGHQLRQSDNMLIARKYRNIRDRSLTPNIMLLDILAKIPSYKPPTDYRRPTAFVDRVYIPQTDFPGVNFIGQILGPRGTTLKALQEEAGASIVIRGKGSVKEGRVRQKTQYGTSDDISGPLHVLITPDTPVKVEEAKKLVQQVINNAASKPEWQNEHKRNQLRDLAVMNGTFRDDEGRLDQREGRQLVHVRRPDQGACIGGPNKMSNFEKEYQSLLNDIGEKQDKEVVLSHESVSSANLPPWRVDRIRQLQQY